MALCVLIYIKERVVFKLIIKRLLPYSVCKIFYGYHYIRGGITIQEEKTYYNQKCVIDEIHKDTGCSVYEISKILNSLGNVVKDKFSDKDKYVEIKLFPGLKVTSRYIPLEQSSLNLCHNGMITSDYLLYLDGEFSNRFKNEIKEKHKNVDKI